MSAHTPGPWKAVSDVASAEFDCMEIAEVAYMRVVPERGGWPRAGTPENDAYLIAAAPELLEACVAMIEWDEREKDHAVDFHARMALCDAAFQKALAAIAKAEGRS